MPGKGHVTIVTVDAKQRHVLVNPINANPNAGEKRDVRICAEAAPDAFSALATSLGGDFGTGSTETRAKVSASIAETAATIERTQTVNLLRESLYRTCERYLSGAIGTDTFIVQAARDQRAMVNVLAIEQLTRALRSQSTIISGPATSASVISNEETRKLLIEADQRLKAAEATVKAKKLSLKAAEDGGVCAEPKAADAEDRDTDTDKADPEQCAELKLAVQGTETESVSAKATVDSLIKIAGALADDASAVTQHGTTVKSSGITKADIDGAAIAEVARAVWAITSVNTIDEPLMFCLARFSRGNQAVVAPVSTLNETESQLQTDAMCRDIIQAKASFDLKQQEFDRLEQRNIRSLPSR